MVHVEARAGRDDRRRALQHHQTSQHDVVGMKPRARLRRAAADRDRRADADAAAVARGAEAFIKPPGELHEARRRL